MRGLIERAIQAMEKTLGVELQYLRYINDQARGILLPLALFLPLSAYRKSVPASVINVARIAATIAQDCGECLQIAVNVARDEGVPEDVIQAALRGDADMLRGGEADALIFAERIASGLDASESREFLHDQFGDRGVIEISMAVATAQVFPVLKRGLGYAQHCDINALTLEAA